MKDQSFMSEESESAWVDDESTWNDGISAEASGDAADFGWQKNTNDARGVRKAADRLYTTDHGTYRVRMDMSSDNIVKGKNMPERLELRANMPKRRPFKTS